MAHWISIEEGSYLVEAGFLFTAGYSAVRLDEGLIEVYLDGSEERRLRGEGRATNVLIVELLEDYDDIDLLIDLGSGFHYLLKTPKIMAGKIFSPDVKSVIRFIATGPAQRLDGTEYAKLRDRLTLLDP